jgi:hypothetical protein
MTSQIPPNIASKITKVSPNDKVAFLRRTGALEEWVTATISPIETQIQDLRAKLLPLYDRMETLKADAVEHCIHSVEFLVLEDQSVDTKPTTSASKSVSKTLKNTAEPTSELTFAIRCKFCNSKFHVSE